MAEITNNRSRCNKGKRNNHSTKVDLTPMVDLGFLLITFFIFTTTLSSNTVMGLVMPKDSTDSTRIAASGAVTLIAAHNGVYWHQGNDMQTAKTFGWNRLDSLRYQLLRTKQALIQKEHSYDKLFVLITPHSSSRFGQLMQLFDEMTICGIKRYSLANISAADAVRIDALLAR
jgi:biopolymer transport protein ExbD